MPKTATLNLNGIIMPDDWIWFDESGISLPRVQRLVEQAGEFDELTVFINSEGGVIEEGFAIYDYLLSLGKPITTIGLGSVYSMATVLMLMGTTRLLSAHTKFMIHLPGGGAFGNRLDLQEYVDLLIAEEKRIVDVYVEKTGKADTEIAELLADGKDHYFTADESLDYGWTTGIYQTIEPATALRSRQPIMAHLSQGRKGLGLPEKKLPTTQPIDMSKITNRAKAAWDSVMAALNGTKMVNLSVDTQDGKKLDIETTEGNDTYVVGDSVKYDDGTDVPDGDYILSDGNTITVAGGVITAIAEPEEDAKDPAEPAPSASADGENVTITKAEFDRLKALDTEVTNLKNKQAENDKFQERVKAVLKGMESKDPLEPVATVTPVDRRVPAQSADPVAELAKQRREARAQK